MESRDLQILDSGEIEVDPTLLNSVVVAITENKYGYDSGDNDIELQQILFYSTQFHSCKKFNKDIHEMISMKHPAFECNGILDIDSIMPVDILMACLECWRLFCVNCKCLHLGMTCENYQFSRQLNLLYGQHHYGGYHDKLEEDEEEEEEDDDDDEEGE
ncbi:hypothetical protein MTR67_025745 [Solanum verrucosum]|uniref:Uncharacterized protein n=1 Tax=Solanum verrucosum TaxID=315347 RepID=A0AAF0R0S4_SOLVR|nr:hypothetical protein MTR67_025745 [Solanum verrucosum]